MKILVAVDGSIFTKHAVGYVLQHFDMLGRDSAITLINVHAPIPPHAAAHLGRATVQQQFEYTSGTMLATPVGAMRGTYKIVAEDGNFFDAVIEPFTLAVPRVLN